jgi:hypothetical protein
MGDFFGPLLMVIDKARMVLLLVSPLAASAFSSLPARDLSKENTKNLKCMLVEVNVGKARNNE